MFYDRVYDRLGSRHISSIKDSTVERSVCHKPDREVRNNDHVPSKLCGMMPKIETWGHGQ